MEAGASDAYIVPAQIARPVSVNKTFFKCVCLKCLISPKDASFILCVRACVRVSVCMRDYACMCFLSMRSLVCVILPFSLYVCVYVCVCVCGCTFLILHQNPRR